VKISSVLPKCDTCVNYERGYCILAHYEEKSLSVSQNASLFGRYSFCKTMTKTVIFGKNKLAFINITFEI
jgi:hypothetical protein